MTEPAPFDDAPEAPITSEDATESPAAPVFAEREARPNLSRAPIGPGMWEALLWILGFFLLEIAGGIIGAMAAFAFQAIRSGGPASPVAINDLLEDAMPWMIGFIKLVEVIAAILAIRLRFGRNAFRMTGFRPIPGLHWGVLCFAVLPTAFVSGQLYALFQGYWNRIAEHVPSLELLEKLSSIETVQAMAESTSLPFLVVIIAVLPALNEEFLFRAAIGRGLLGRYGLVAGVALTSMLFAAMHMSPIHAAALVPLAVLMHIGYLSSGSIWWPVGVHFLNNAMSVVLMKAATMAPEDSRIAAELTESSFSPYLFFASLACVVATIWLLWKIRVQWRRETGEAWEPERLSVEPPPRSLEMTPYVPSPPVATVVLAGLSYLMFPVALAFVIWMNQV
ncbi:MAG: CPBP family intramembrane metalloprotease [Planctomycetaceae bacterium]|nr:CPBP family intramembrane metalloprotease [Planctomycetaceae bacterium]